VGPRTHDPLTCSVDRTLHVAVRQRPCSRLPSRWLSRASRQPRPMCLRRASRLPDRFPGSTIERDVLPAPPFGGAPRLPRPSSALRHEGGHGVDLGDARSRSASRPISREIGQLLWGSAPLRALSCVRTERRRLVYPSFGLPLRAVHLGVAAPSPEHPWPLLSPFRRPPGRRAFAPRQVPRVGLVSVAELGYCSCF